MAAPPNDAPAPPCPSAAPKETPLIDPSLLNTTSGTLASAPPCGGAPLNGAPCGPCGKEGSGKLKSVDPPNDAPP